MENVRTLLEHLNDYLSAHPDATVDDLVGFVEERIEEGDLLATEDAELAAAKRRGLEEALRARLTRFFSQTSEAKPREPHQLLADAFRNPRRSTSEP
jgi:hypothetical protein